MATSIFGLFDDRSEAQRCIDRLTASDFDKGDISVLANKDVADFRDADTRTVNDSEGSNAAKGAAAGAVTGGVLGGAGGLLLGLGALAIPGIGPIVAAGPIAAGLTGAGIGAGTGAAAGGIIGALQKAGVPEEEAHLYAEGIRRGGFLVSVTTDDQEDVPEIQQIMMDCGAVDIHRRGEYWKKDGFKQYDQAATPYTQEQIQSDRKLIQQASSDMMKFPIVKEDLQVGKRQVERGGVRVKSYVHEKPVEMPVELREEHVSVHRQPVDRPASASDFETFKEGTVELHEMGEEAVVQKQARVVEEVQVGKTADKRTETVRDTVRGTDVQVEQLGGGDFAGMDSMFRQDYDSHYANQGLKYEEVTPAYQYGYELGQNREYQGRSWDDFESDAGRQWSQKYPNYEWSKFKNAVRYGYDSAHSRRNRAEMI